MDSPHIKIYTYQGSHVIDLSDSINNIVSWSALAIPALLKCVCNIHAGWSRIQRSPHIQQTSQACTSGKNIPSFAARPSWYLQPCIYVLQSFFVPLRCFIFCSVTHFIQTLGSVRASQVELLSHFGTAAKMAGSFILQFMLTPWLSVLNNDAATA